MNEMVGIEDIDVYLGDHDIFDSEKLIMQLSRILPHSSYDRKTDTWDAAILTLEHEVAFSQLVLPVCMPPDPPKTYVGW